MYIQPEDVSNVHEAIQINYDSMTGFTYQQNK